MILMRTVETYKANTAIEVEEIIQKAEMRGGDLTKKTVEFKEHKSKGEVDDEGYKVTIQIDWEKDFWTPDYPDGEV